jgi:flagellar motor switch protein FliM
LAGLQPGDILLTDVLSSAEVSLEVDGREIFRGTPGQRHNRKVVCLSARIASERAR